MSMKIMMMTPPIRRITAHQILSTRMDNNHSNEQIYVNNNESTIILRERSNSSSSDSSITSPKSSNNNSLRSFSTDHSLNHDDDDDDDDGSSNDEINEQWNSSQLITNISSRQIISGDSLSISNEDQNIPIELSECKICLEKCRITLSSCCSSSICCECQIKNLSSHIKEGRIRIMCPSCPHIYTRDEILLLLSLNPLNEELSERYKRYYADVNGEPHIKTCPRCCAIKQIDKKLFEGIRWKEKIPRKVHCDECQFEWCFFCHSPWHDKITCKEYRQGEKMLQSWANQINQNQQNAQKCPRCKVYISRNGGCPHMVCSKCQCDFCYNCGRKRIGMKFLGSHESRYSPFGCKFNLYPDKPILRHTVRGLVAGAATLAVPVAAVGAVALLAVGTTIAGPTYGTYRLVKHIRSQRAQRHRRQQFEALSKQWTNNQSSTRDNNNNNGTRTDIDDYHRAVQASLITFREENQRREQMDIAHYHLQHLNYSDQNDDDDDDDDSIDE